MGKSPYLECARSQVLPRHYNTHTDLSHWLFLPVYRWGSVDRPQVRCTSHRIGLIHVQMRLPAISVCLLKPRLLHVISTSVALVNLSRPGRTIARRNLCSPQSTWACRRYTHPVSGSEVHRVFSAIDSELRGEALVAQE